ncbi:MAG: hypothetical protein ABI882_15830, partial [Acidobacteriota bacterium]
LHSLSLGLVVEYSATGFLNGVASVRPRRSNRNVSHVDRSRMLLPPALELTGGNPYAQHLPHTPTPLD